MASKAPASQHKSILWLTEKQRCGIDAPTDSSQAQAVSAKIAKELVAGNVNTVARNRHRFFVYLAQTGYPGQGAFSDCLIDNTLAVVNRLSAEMHSALQEHDGHRRKFCDALILARNWIASYGLLSHWVSCAGLWRCESQGIGFTNRPDNLDGFSRMMIDLSVRSPFEKAHESASNVLTSVIGNAEATATSIACAWLRENRSNLGDARLPHNVGRDLHEGFLILRRIVFGTFEPSPITLSRKPPTKQVNSPRFPVSQIEAAQICGCSPRQIRNWELGQHTPEGWPGRRDSVVLRAWVETRKGQKRLKEAIKNASPDGERRAITNDPKDKGRRYGGRNQGDIDAQEYS